MLSRAQVDGTHGLGQPSLEFCCLSPELPLGLVSCGYFEKYRSKILSLEPLGSSGCVDRQRTSGLPIQSDPIWLCHYLVNMANETKKGGSGLPLSQPRENLLGGQNHLTGHPQGSSAQRHDQKVHGLCTEPPSDSKDPQSCSDQCSEIDIIQGLPPELSPRHLGLGLWGKDLSPQWEGEFPRHLF